VRRTQATIERESGALSDSAQVWRSVCRDASEHLDADLVSVWRFLNEGEAIQCLCAFDAIDESFSSGHVLPRSDCPTYFATIIEETLVCAPDARTHRVTKELTESYFEPNGIISLLDFIVHQDYSPVGIICCESRSKRRDWTEKDQRYLLALATLASFHNRL